MTKDDFHILLAAIVLAAEFRLAAVVSSILQRPVVKIDSRTKNIPTRRE